MNKCYPTTPGPWEVDSGMVQTVAEHKCHTSNCGVHIPICHMDRDSGNGTMPVERDANAHLIAQAPALLEIAQTLLEWYDQKGCNGSGPSGASLLFDEDETLSARIRRVVEQATHR